MASCRKCLSTWTGLSMAHCPSCCRTFSTAGNFDLHRKNGKCSMKGLVQNEYGTWKQPGERDVSGLRQLRRPSPGDAPVADGEVPES